MPETVATVTMSIQDSDGSVTAETPDRSLGSISLNATGEQLDDIQVNLDRMYLESPAPTSLLMGINNDAAGGHNSVYLANSNVFGGRRNQNVPDADGFDKLQILEIEDISEVIGETDWLCDVPSGLPPNFSEDDRSFLDTGLLNIRYSLLNYVTRAITEEIYAETKRNVPALAKSNLVNEIPGSGATYKVIRRSSAGRIQSNSSQELSPASLEDASSQQILNTTLRLSPNQSFGNYAGSVSKLNTTFEMSSDFDGASETASEQLNAKLDLPSSDYQSPAGSIEETMQNMRVSARSNLMNEAAGSGATFKVKRSGAGRNPLNATIEMPSQQDGIYDGAPSSFEPLNSTVRMSPDRHVKLGNFAGSGSAHKFNTTVELTPNRNPKLGSFGGSTSPHKFNTTVDLTPDHRNSMGSPHHKLNTTIDLSPVDHHTGSPVGAIASHPGGTSLTPVNLNETFVAENGDASPGDKSRRVTRNLSYVIRRDEESPNNNSSPQVSANTSRCDLNSTFSYDPDADREVQAARGSRNTSMEDLNSRVASQIRSLGCSTITRGRYSENSGRVVPNLDETRLVARTSSTDTYSVAHSSESPTSSGLSSPMDAQSYDDIQSSSEAVRRSMPNLAVIRNATNMRSNLAFPQAGAGQLRKNHYISDSRLSRLGNGDNRARLKVHGSESTSTSSSNQGLSASDGTRTRGGSNTSTPAALNRISASTSGAAASRVYSAIALGSTTTSRASSINRPQGSSIGNVRATGMIAPRYTGGLRPPRPTSTSNNIQLQPANVGTTRSSAAGIPVPTFRTQSRIPAPGQFRFSRPSHVNSSNRFGGTTTKGTSASQKGPVDDWRDGCY